MLYDEYDYGPDKPVGAFWSPNWDDWADWWSVCRHTPTNRKCNDSQWDPSIDSSPTREPCEDAVFLEKRHLRAISNRCFLGERPYLAVHHTRNHTALASSNDTSSCYHSLYAMTYCRTDCCNDEERLVQTKHMWGYSDCEKPKRSDLNSTTSGAPFSHGGFRFQLGFFTTTVLTVSTVVVMELAKEWH